MLRGVDVSNWQADMNVGKFDVDFIIAKATEGDYFVDEYCDGFVQSAKASGKLWGFYHFAAGSEPEVEAEFFFNNCSDYFGHGIPVLDFEIDTGANARWCERFITKLHDLTGIWAMLYISASRCSQYAGSWIPERCGLWVAGYPQAYITWTNDDWYLLANMPYDVAPWEFAAIWQFTSSLWIGNDGPLDGDYAYMSADGWAKYAGCKPSDTAAHEKTVEELALEVLDGKHGDGEARKKALGSSYDAVQARVNDYYNAADAVIRGDWGNGWNRKQALTGAGYNYDAVQKIVNAKLGA